MEALRGLFTDEAYEHGRRMLADEEREGNDD
jgi:hypothetical protein